MNRLLRLALFVGVSSGAGLFGLLAWSTGNASRVAQYQALLLWLNGALALALFVWVVALTVRLLLQLRSGLFGARLTARFALAFALIGVLPGTLIYGVSLQFMARSIESWFNVRVDTALESGLALARAALDSQLAELESRARVMTPELNATPDAEVAGVLARLRDSSGPVDAMVFSGTGRVIAFSSDRLGALSPVPPPAAILNQLRVTRGYSNADTGDSVSGGPVDPGLQLRVIVALTAPERTETLLGVNVESRWLQLVQPVSEKIARNASEVQQGNRDYQELALSRQSLRNLFGVTLTLALLLAVL